MKIDPSAYVLDICKDLNLQVWAWPDQKSVESAHQSTPLYKKNNNNINPIFPNIQ